MAEKLGNIKTGFTKKLSDMGNEHQDKKKNTLLIVIFLSYYRYLLLFISVWHLFMTGCKLSYVIFFIYWNSFELFLCVFLYAWTLL